MICSKQERKEEVGRHGRKMIRTEMRSLSLSVLHKSIVKLPFTAEIAT